MASSRKPGPSAPVRALCAYAAAMTRRDFAAARRALVLAHRGGGRRAAAEEAALMLMLYAGYPAALEGLRVLNEAWPGRARATREGGQAAWVKRGEALCRRVYGPAFEKLVPAVRALHPDLATWMVEHGYGRVLSRPGLNARDRELVTVAALGALGWERQLVSHLLGALRVGARPREVEAALLCGLRVAGESAMASGMEAWRRVLAADPEWRAKRTARRS
jgi:alkylhydroperoxidase/carboxymuconolactone decarboxylase family protein YurZ